MKRLVAIWIGLLGECLLITAEVIDPSPRHYTAMDEIESVVREYVWPRS